MTPATKAKMIAKHGSIVDSATTTKSSLQGEDDGFREVWDAGAADSGVPVLSSEATTTAELRKKSGMDTDNWLDKQQRTYSKKNNGKKKKKNKYKNL